jgi:transcriptional regulator of acetoin/glycerol metabolism
VSDATLSTTKLPPSPETSAALFVVLTAHEPWAQSSRHALAGIMQVEVLRGERAVERGRELVLVLPDRRLSSKHARLRLVGGRWHVEDLDSKNGVFRNGVAVAGRAALEDGDVLEMGRSFFVFRARQTPAPGEPLDRMADALPAVAPGLVSLMPGLAARFAELARAAASDLPIMLYGETGTGKEVAARAVHTLSQRRGPLTPINCGALPRSLLEAELFGFKKGSFSGALEDKAGLIAASHRGTLFLDEVAELPLDGQAALLRVLQEREVLAIGTSRAQPVDLRVVSATHRNLEAAVAAGQFRADLHARLGGFKLVLPPLRERREDLGMIVQALLDRLAPGAQHVLSHAAARMLFARTWPNNVRELERALHVATVMAHDTTLELADEPEAAPPPPPRLRRRDHERRAELERLLREHHGNVTAVARALGKAREQVHRWIKRAGLDPEQFRGASSSTAATRPTTTKST